jgi:succinyl-diaminopimelate desuccinylase
MNNTGRASGTQQIAASLKPREHLKRVALGSRDLLVEIAQELIRTDSQTPPSDTGAVAEIAASYLRGWGSIDVKLHPSDQPVINLVARLKGGLPGPRLVLSGHLDTYPVGDPTRWSVGPFSGAVSGDRLYGRGSADMKGGIAALILVMRLLAKLGQPFRGEVVLALAGDEESMGELGTQRLINSVPEVIGDGVIVADVGSPNIIRCGEKGMVWIEVRARGKASHGAHLHRGDNAIRHLMVALERLKAIDLLPVDNSSETSRYIEAAGVATESDLEERRVTTSITSNLGRIRGGISANLVPDSATAELDIRLPLGVTVGTVEAKIAELFADLPQISWRSTRRYEPSWTPPESPVVRACADAAREVLDAPVRIDMRIGASDARLWRRAGIPTAVCGLTPYNLGGSDESFSISELIQLAAIHVLAAWDFLERLVAR